MNAPTAIVPPEGLVLVTGVSGFVGSHIASRLLGLGYRVRGIVRSEDKAVWVKEGMARCHPAPAFETVIIADLTILKSWDKAVKSVDGIVHVATDMSFGTDPNKIINPIVRSVRVLLEAAARETSVKRFVLTSSNRTLLNPIYGKEVIIDRSM